jgi:hypothetical protein
MGLWLHRSIAIGVVTCGLYVVPARADTRLVGQAFVYDITQTTNMKVDLSNLPASIRGRAEANQAAVNNKPTTWTVTMTTDRLDADGSAHVNVKFTNSIEAATPAGAVFAARNKFGGTLAADGRLSPAYDPNMEMTYDSHGLSPAAQIENVNAQKIAGLFTDFNTFAAGCSKHAHYKVGDAWRVVSQDPYGVSREYDFSVTALESVSGHDAPAVSMRGEFASQGSSAKVSASGHYDVARHLVLDLHEDTAFNNSSGPNAATSSGTGSTDYKLQQ